MIGKEDILNMARHVARRGQGIPDRRIIHPARDWFVGLLFTALLFGGFGGAAGYLFLSKSGAALKEPQVTMDPVSYDTDLIKKTLEMYRARRNEVDGLRGTALPLEIVEPVVDEPLIEDEDIGEEGGPIGDVF